MTDAKKFFLFAYLCLQALDVITTISFLANGTGVEGNPIMAYAMVHLGYGWIAVKAAIVMVTLPVLAAAGLRYVIGMSAMYAFVVLNNVMLG